MLPLALARRRRAPALLDLHQGETALDMLALAERRCTGRSHLTFQEANAIDYRFRRQRLTPQPPFKSTNTCLTSQRRCVRCGDLASLAWEAENRARAEKMFHAREEHLADAYLPSRLASLLREAGFELAEVEPCTMRSLI